LSAQLQTPEYAVQAVNELKLSISTSALLSHLYVITMPESFALQVDYDDTVSNRGTLIVGYLTRVFMLDTFLTLVANEGHPIQVSCDRLASHICHKPSTPSANCPVGP
jgi:hypothetical protein